MNKSGKGAIELNVKLWQVDFPMEGPFKEEMTVAMKELAESIAEEEGLLWKIWTENEEKKRAGGWYAFKNESSLIRYRDMHVRRLASFGIEDIAQQIFDANVPLSVIDHFPIELLTRTE